jgi:hypothetical protein
VLVALADVSGSNDSGSRLVIELFQHLAPSTRDRGGRCVA